ncbi:MAG TPA: pseudouridine synthase, partial [Bacillota bacterium]|nr:pseudouridine synthase [Bacillota bacterium]
MKETMKYNERIDKILSSSGIMTRREAKRAALCGRISLDGVTVKSVDTRITQDNTLTLDGKLINYKKYIYIMMDKPEGYVCSTDEPGEKSVLELLHEPYSKMTLFPAGRLDKNTTGFVLLTNDGVSAHNLLSPGKHVVKKYIYTLASPVSPEALANMENGCVLEDGYITKKCTITALNDYSGYITLTEGKYHQIKRMFLAAGSKVTSLRRICYNGIEID